MTIDCGNLVKKCQTEIKEILSLYIISVYFFWAGTKIFPESIVLNNKENEEKLSELDYTNVKKFIGQLNWFPHSETRLVLSFAVI